MAHSFDHPHDSDDRLSEPDAEALDALVEAGFDASAVPESLRARAERILLMMSMFEAGEASQSSTLVQRTMDAIVFQEAELSVDDQEALDAMVAAGYQTQRVSASLRPRAERIEAMMQLVTTLPVESAGTVSLVARTHAMIRATPMKSSEPANVVGRVGFGRLADLFSVAAAAVLGVSVLWPVLSAWKTHSMKVNCGSNMATVAGAMGAYAGDFRAQLPMATASLAGPTWWDVGSGPGRSNSANLYQLPKLQYAKLSDLACPGNPAADTRCECDRAQDWSCDDQVSYSYHVMFSSVKPQWGERAGSMPMVVLADKSPVVARSRMHQAVNPLENSRNHGGDGQWTLRTDGSGAWLHSPQVGEDNIWMPAVVDRVVTVAKREMNRTGANMARVEFMLSGQELSTERGNTFVGP